jgi:chromosome segregation ATPase
MIDSLRGAPVRSVPPTTPSSDRVVSQLSDQQGEAASLSGAIQRLISERDSHRNRLGAQEHELTRLRAINEELRGQSEHAVMIRDHYLRLAEVLTTLKNIDHAIHEVVQRTLCSTGTNENSDAALISLARRFSPAKPPSNDVPSPR